jgi:hypothetical protein
MSHTMSRFDRVVLGAILANTAILVASLVIQGHEAQLELADRVILLFFAAEIGLRFHAAGRRCLRDRWLLFDTVLVLVALAPVAGADVILLRMARACRIAHFSRHLPHLHIVSLRLYGCWSAGWRRHEAAGRGGGPGAHAGIAGGACRYNTRRAGRRGGSTVAAPF